MFQFSRAHFLSILTESAVVRRAGGFSPGGLIFRSFVLAWLFAVSPSGSPHTIAVPQTWLKGLSDSPALAAALEIVGESLSRVVTHSPTRRKLAL